MQITVPLPAAWCSRGGQLREASTLGTDTLMLKSQHSTSSAMFTICAIGSSGINESFND